MTKTDTVLFSSSFYPNTDNTRFKLACETILAAREEKLPIVIVDGSLNPLISKVFQELGAIVFPETCRGMGPSRREALRHAMQMDFDIYTWLELEKHTIVKYLRGCVAHMREHHLNMLIPRRHNLDSYPDYQHWSELRANHEIANIIGRGDLDYMIGPRMYDLEAAKLTLEYDGQKFQQYGYSDNWEVLFIPVLWAIHQGMQVGSILVDYIHPPEQTAEEQGNAEMDQKRDKQRIDLVTTMAKEAVRIGYKSPLEL